MRVIFNENIYNKYSISALISALEHKGLLEDIEVIIEDSDFFKEFKSHRDKVIFCFSFCSPQKCNVFDSLRKLKENYPEAIFIAGGPHPSGDPEDTLKAGFDYVLAGEGENTLPKLLKTLHTSEVKSKIINGDRVDINNFPPWSEKFHRLSPIEITRGCPYACKFCQTSFLFGTIPRHRSIENIIEYVEKFYKNGKRDLRFITPNALSYGSPDGKTINLQLIERLLKSIREISESIRIFFGTFPSEVRPEFINKEVLQLIKPYIFNKTLTIGAQTGSDSLLLKINRGHTIDEVYYAVDNATECGFSVNVDFIFGFPEETEKDQIETINFIDRLISLGDKRNVSVKIHAHHFMPLPGTPFHNKKPAKLSEKLTRYLGRLYNRKKIFGDLYKQILFCKRLIK